MYFEMMQEITRMQSKAVQMGDSGWTKVGPAWNRVIYTVDRPTEFFIQSLFKSAPEHTDKWHHVEHDEVNGVYSIALGVRDVAG